MRYLSGAAKNSLWLPVPTFLLAGLLLILVCTMPTAGAVSSNVDVAVCGAAVPAAQIDVTEPLSDSVVSNAVSTLRGTVANVTQVDITVDGQYNNSFSLGANEATFEVDITLSEGTHTITLTANAVCGGQTATANVVLTYSPEVTEPSSGGMTPTEIDGTTTLDGVPVEADAINQGDIARRIEQLPLLGAAVSIVSDFATSIGLESTVFGNNTPVATGAARVGLTVAAITMVVLASTLAPMAATSIPGVSEYFNVKSHRSMIYLGWAIRGVGALALALAWFL